MNKSVKRAGAPIPTTEKEMVEVLVSTIGSHFAPLRFALEVRSHGRSRADMILWVDEELIAVEAKRLDWKRAIFQAVLNRYCVDRSYVALWDSYVTAEVLSDARTWGLGVLSVGPSRLEIVQAAPATTPDRILRGTLLENLTASMAGK
jgi:hypothetical protein